MSNTDDNRSDGIAVDEDGAAAPAAKKPVTSPQKKLSTAIPDFQREVLTDKPTDRYGAMSRNGILEDVTSRAIAAWQEDDSGFPIPADKERELLRLVNEAFKYRGMKVMGSGKDKDTTQGDYKPLLELTSWQVGHLMLSLHHVVNVQPSGTNSDPDFDLLAMYVDEGPDEGIHVTSKKLLRGVMRKYNSAITVRGADEVLAILEEAAVRVPRETDPDVVPVQNGLYDYAERLLRPFDPEVVILSKARVPIRVEADGCTPIARTLPVRRTPDGDDWDVESWIREISSYSVWSDDLDDWEVFVDDEVVRLHWETMGAVVRPYVRWSKSAWYYSDTGNNGKGTLVELLRCLVGEASYVNLPISEMGKDFALEGLTRATAILTDENDVGTVIDKAANLKAIITNDALTINRKFRTAVTFQFWGFMVQCLNELPRIKDVSGSLARRQLFVPFRMCFTGKERSYIKNQYMSDPEVLEYVLWKVLVDMDPYHRLSEPDVCSTVQEEYEEGNNPVQGFWNDVEGELVWDFVPRTFLWDLYKEWFSRNNPSGGLIGRNKFYDRLSAAVDKSQLFYSRSKRSKHRVGDLMDSPEPLILQYDLESWKNPGAKNSNDINKVCTPVPPVIERGYHRRDPMLAPAPETTIDADVLARIAPGAAVGAGEAVEASVADPAE